MWGALPPYLGGKRRLCPTIFREIDRLVSRRLWGRVTFLDAFLGGGSVSLYAKAQGFRVVATDIAERAIPIIHGVMGKELKEPGLEVADFIAHAAGNQTKKGLKDQEGLRKDFRVVFQPKSKGAFQVHAYKQSRRVNSI